MGTFRFTAYVDRFSRLHWEVEGAYTNIPIIETQGWDDGDSRRGGNAANYHSSEEMVVKHNYITEYMNLIGKPPATPYVQRFYVLRFK